MLIQLAKKLGVKVEMLKDTNSPNLETRKAIEELESGKGKTYENLEDLMKDLNS
jgi:NH3-dependent NAD+ synthetase